MSFDETVLHDWRQQGRWLPSSGAQHSLAVAGNLDPSVVWLTRGLAQSGQLGGGSNGETSNPLMEVVMALHIRAESSGSLLEGACQLPAGVITLRFRRLLSIIRCTS